MLCRCWLWEGKPLRKRSYWEANEHLSFVISVQVQEIKPHFLLQFFLFFLFFFTSARNCCLSPRKAGQRDIYCRCFNTLTTSRGWSLAAEVGQDSQSVADEDGGGARGGGRRGHPYLQRSSCVESRTFFLFLLLPWWCGLLL